MARLPGRNLAGDDAGRPDTPPAFMDGLRRDSLRRERAPLETISPDTAFDLAPGAPPRPRPGVPATGGQPAPPVAPPSRPRLRRLLASRSELRRAVLLREILDPPRGLRS